MAQVVAMVVARRKNLISVQKRQLGSDPGGNWGVMITRGSDHRFKASTSTLHPRSGIQEPEKHSICTSTKQARPILPDPGYSSTVHPCCCIEVSTLREQPHIRHVAQTGLTNPINACSHCTKSLECPSASPNADEKKATQ